MSAELKIREALAAGPTPGPWSLHARSSMSVAGPGSTVVAACGGHADNSRNPDELQAELQANALLITACNPAAIAELLAELDRLRATPAPGAPGQEAVSWQVRRTDGSPLACWETCTKDLYDLTLSTGRYCGFENGPPCEVRALGVIAAPPLSHITEQGDA